MVSEIDRKKFRKQNKQRKEYFKEYYKNYDKHYDDMERISAMRLESGYASEKSMAWEKMSKKKLVEQGHVIEIEGIKLYSLPYAIKKTNNLKENTFREYLLRGVIPEPIYIRKQKNGLIRKYLSKRQVIMINRQWNARTKKHDKEKISEYLHNHWLDGELGGGGESDD